MFRLNCRIIATAIWLVVFVSQAARAETVTLVIDAPLKGPAKLALADFEAALANRKIEVKRQTTAVGIPWVVVIGTARDSAEVRKLIHLQYIDLPGVPESLCSRLVFTGGTPSHVLIAGRDDRGLSYALLEAARVVELAEPNLPVFGLLGEESTPALAVRSVSVHPMNADLEAEWYYSEEYWRGYFKMLAQNRFNRFILTFSDQTNYLCPLYAYTVEVPEYPQVRVRGLDAAGKRRNLDMLRRISDMAAERGIDFTLAIWMQSPVPRYSGEVKVENLPEGLAAADYCARGLRMILDACPAISGVQFRLNSEAGVKEEEQTEFYRPLFKAMADCGRPLRLDLRYKGLQESTIAAARELNLDLTVSTKFWAEHFGLPYHPTEVDKHYRKDRYSFGSMLKKPRDYRVVYQLWTAGSMRIFPWGDPNYVKQFVESCKLGDGEGFEIFAPLTNKGYGDAPGNWRLLKNPADEWYRWEYERYWCFYLLFGRLGFNSVAGESLWHREFVARFGNNADAWKLAHEAAGRILPLITASHLPSASEWGYWPEMDTGGRLEEYIRVPPSDPGMFYAICSWKKTSGWAWEDWDETIPGYVNDAARGNLSGKQTPQRVALALLKTAETVEDWAYSGELHRQTTPLVKNAQRDLNVLAQLARYHGHKMQAGVHLGFFQLDNTDGGRLNEAIANMRLSAEAWRAIVKLTDGFYHENLVFGITPDSPRSTLGRHHSGHWKDRLPEVLEDVAYLERLIKEHDVPKDAKVTRKYLGENDLYLDVKIAMTPISTATAGRDLPVSFKVAAFGTINDLRLHYRPLNQNSLWKSTTLTLDKQSNYLATIPGCDIAAEWDLQILCEVLTPDGGSRTRNDSRTPYWILETMPATAPP